MNSRAYCTRFNFRGGDQQKKVGQLSGGERNRVHLAKLLRGGGNLLLLDEPTNDLDVNTLRTLEEAVTNFGGCAVVVSHDRPVRRSSDLLEVERRRMVPGPSSYPHPGFRGRQQGDVV